MGTHLRHRLSCRALAVLLGMLPLAACQTSNSTTPVRQIAAAAKSEPIAVEGDYVHRYAFFRFPTTIADFKRVELVKYDADASDVSATYSRSGPAGAALATIYVYPAPWVRITAGGQYQYPDLTDRQLGGLCRNEIEAVKAAVAALHPSATIVREGGDVLKGAGGARIALGRVEYRMTGSFEGRIQPLQSQLYVMCFGYSQWILKFRLTAPEGVDLDAVYGVLGRGTLPDRTAPSRS
ncbi:hypothetical protein P409_27665 [Inquilinus limosus MP06]|uniref:Lipoprotein n=1 Tax=Inquilinus limosus MP06 TaxID=1398085 RepID=A0A0A0CY45_9PROT|nr:hypothetical protein P409_27665 [Inquilinus limosus MP06]